MGEGRKASGNEVGVEGQGILAEVPPQLSMLLSLFLPLLASLSYLSLLSQTKVAGLETV